jgi:hypothetical protein
VTTSRSSLCDELLSLSLEPLVDYVKIHLYLLYYFLCATLVPTRQPIGTMVPLLLDSDLPVTRGRAAKSRQLRDDPQTPGVPEPVAKPTVPSTAAPDSLLEHIRSLTTGRPPEAPLEVYPEVSVFEGSKGQILVQI